MLVARTHDAWTNLSEQALHNRGLYTWDRRDFGDEACVDDCDADPRVHRYTDSCVAYPSTCSSSTHQSQPVCATSERRRAARRQTDRGRTVDRATLRASR